MKIYGPKFSFFTFEKYKNLNKNVFSSKFQDMKKEKNHILFISGFLIN